MPARPLALTRIGVGLASLFEALQRLPLVDAAFDRARFHLSYGLPALPPELAWLPFAAWLIGSIGLVLGFRARASACLAVFGHGLFFFADRQHFTNHGYLILLLVVLVALADSAADLSLDARRRGVRSDVERWPAELLRIQLGLVYFFAGVSKLNPDWLSGAFLEFLLEPESFASVALRLTPQGLRLVAAFLALLEITLGTLIWLARAPRIAIALGAFLHLGILAAFPRDVDLLVFALACLAVYPLLEPLRARERAAVL